MIALFSLPLLEASGSEPHGQVLGFYSNGSLVGSADFPSEGDGFAHLFESRNRHYGSEGLLQLIRQAASSIAQAYPDGERLQVGDIAARDGGPISGHASHQNGLDADIVFYRNNHHEQTAADGDQGFIENFAPNGVLSSNFDLERNWAIIKLFEASGRLARIFVATAIKKGLCAYARSQGELASHAEALRRLSILDSHFDHMHVRITCPTGSPACVKQQDPPPGTGCN